MDTSPLLPYRTAAPPSPQRYLDDLHSAPKAAPFSVASLSEDDRLLLLKRQLRLAGEARFDLAQFFQFVFRDETVERRPIRTAAHQRVVFQFIRHYRYCVVRLPTNFSKTYCMAAAGLYDTGHNLG